MAASLRRAGMAPYVFDICPGVAQAFAQDGGTACASVAELAAACNVVVSVVVNAQQTEQVLFGGHGDAGAAKAASGQMTMMTAGTPAAYERCGAALDAMAAQVYRLGDRAGAGSKVKIINQLKDLGLVLDTARATKFPLPLASTAHQMFMQASSAGFGREDDSAVIRIFPGIELPKAPG